MNTNSTEQKNRVAAAGQASSTGKKPYVKPTVQFEKVFETMALSCGKVRTTEGSCAHNRKSS